MAPRKSKKDTILKSKRVTHWEHHDDGPFDALIQELGASLGVKTLVKISNEIFDNIRDTLRRLREIGEKVNFEVVESIVVSIDGFQGACSLLRPNTFVAIVEILLHAQSSHHRDRGLFLLDASLHNESQKLEGNPRLQSALSIVGNGCLQQVFNSFCDKVEKYETRRWTGLLLLELIVNSDENKQVIELMPESRRRNLGPLVLYEKNEILRTISGRILTTLIASNIPTNNFFPQNTDLELITCYPEPALSASQWDKTFQNYLDKIWDKISDIENQGKMEFAQNVTSQPEYLNTKNISVYHRSLYTAFADCVHIYVHSGGKEFDAAIDIPYNLISDVRVERTPLDGVIKVEPPADLILRVRHLEGEYAYVNSAISELSIVRLTFSDMSSTELIAKALREYVAKSSYRRGEQEVAGYDGKASTAQGGCSEVDSQSSFKRKISQSGDGLVLNGEYGAANVETANTQVEREIPMREKVLAAASVQISQKAASIAAKMTESLPNNNQSKALISVSGGRVQDDYADLYDASPPPPRSHAQKMASKTNIAEQVDVNDRRKLAKPRPAAASIAVPGPCGKNFRSTGVQSEAKNNQEIVKSSSQEPKTSTPADGHNSSETLYGKRADDGLDSTQNDDSIDETTRMLPKKKQAAPLRKIQILKSKKPLNASKQVITATNDVPSSSHPHDAVDEQTHPSVQKHIAGHAQIKVNTDTTTKKVDKTYGNKGKGRASTGAIPDCQSDVREVISPADGKKKRSKKRQSAPVLRNQAAYIPRSTRSTAISANQKITEMNASQKEDEDVRHGTSVESQTKNSLGKAFSPKSQIIQATKDKENIVIETVIPAEYETVPERSILKAKKALAAKGAGANKRNETQSKIEPEDIHSDIQETFNQHTSFFEDGTVFQDFEPADLEDEIPSVPVLTSRPVTAMASKMQKIFGALDDLDDLVQPKQKLRAYGKDTPKFASTSAMSVKQVKGNGPKRGTIETANSSPVQSKPKIRSLGTKSNSRGLSLQKDVETICISSDEDSNASEKAEHKQQGTLAKAAPEKSSIKIVPTATARDGTSLILRQDQANSESRQLMQDIKAEKLSDERAAASVLSKMPSNRLRGTEKLLNKLPSTPNISEVEHISLKIQAISRRSPARSKMQSTPTTLCRPQLSICDTNAPTTLQTTASSVPSLVDDYLARKTPLVAFDKNGAKNQGLFSTLRGKAMTKPIQGKDIPLATVTVTEELVGKKRMLQDEPLPNPEAPAPKRPKVSKSTPNIIEVVDNNQFDANIRDFVQSSSQLALQSDRHVFSSQSRVDENGSPRARTTMAEQSEDMNKIKKNLLSDTSGGFKAENPQFSSIPEESWDFHDDYLPPVCDDYPINQEDYIEFSSNHKPQPSAPDQDIDFMARYAPHKSATNGDYVDVVTAKALEPAHDSADPFREKKRRHLSDFAKRLKGETPFRTEIITTVESERVVAAKAPIRKLSIPFLQAMAADDPEKTLVDVENHLPYELAKSQRQISSDSSDVSDDRSSVEDYEAEELTAEEQWREALKPHQKNLSDTLHCIVEGFVHQLIDKESALDNVVHDYLKNGTKLVQSIEDKAATDRRGLQLQVFDTLRQVTSKFQQSRDATNILTRRAQGQLYEVEKAWRKTQHGLQDLLKDKITERKKLMVAEQNA